MKKSHQSVQLSRRRFLRRGATAAGAILAAPSIIPSTALGVTDREAPSNRLNIGVIGLGGRGRYVMGAFMAQSDAQVVAVCDVFGDRRQRGVDMVNQRYGNENCASYIDFLELLERDDIDAVLIATGDNWHSGVALEAARAGKDMYCEKPMSVTISESRAVSDTMRRLGRIFQCGTQRRSLGHFRFAADLAQSGKLGEITKLVAEEAPGFQEFTYDLLPAEPEPARDVFDWNRWLGPAPWRPYNQKYPTRGFWSFHVDFSGASVTEWGSHTVDLCQWAYEVDDTSPVEYWREDKFLVGRYAKGAELYIGTLANPSLGSCPFRVEGTEGWVETGDSGKVNAHPRSLLGNRGFEGGYPPGNHVRAFLDDVKLRRQPVANAEVAHRSISACHVANICKRLNRPVEWDPETETVIGDEEAQRLTTRAYRSPWYL